MQVTNVNEYVRIYTAKPRNSCGRMFEVKELKNTGGASRAEYTHNVMKKYVRLITSGYLTLCRRCNNNLLFIQPLQIFHKIGYLKS